MFIVLPGSLNMFGRLRNGLSKGSKTRIVLRKGVHQVLENFRWIANDLISRPMRLAKLIPLAPVVEGHGDASGKGAGGAWFTETATNWMCLCSGVSNGQISSRAAS
jgi:hypothetical protein